ncbi:MAG TPA: Ig domain-containing protein, partial [Terriglobales bacterium]|nr:Ig domain-containing protein [Terriglobales bacterium]
TKLAISSATLPEATEGNPYSVTLSATGGTTPYHWSVVSGKLPSGFVFDASSGTIDGSTSQTGVFSVTVSASDAAGQSATRALSLSVVAANAGSADGPAELPRVHVSSAMSDTPAAGATQLVKTSADLQTSLNSAQCGDTISLQAGATFTGAFTFPAKHCDDAHWIMVRTSAPDSALPPEGTRVTPCYGGIAALPGRPSLACANTNKVLATLTFSGTGSGPVQLADGANHYRLLGLEITRSSPKAIVYNLVSNKGVADHIVIDRSWLHGTAQDETTRGVMLSGSTYVAIVDSFFNDFHCVAVSGTCTDSQAIAGGTGTHPMGPYKIFNNFLEAAGQSILFGGGSADHTPEDIEIRHNHMFKPTTWQKGQPGYVGGRDGNPFIVKNLFELKNGIRVLFEGNLLENVWGGFSQNGFAVLLTPKNQNGLCPQCVVHDITIRYASIAHTGAGFQIANAASDSGALSLGIWNVSIHDVLIDDVDAKAYDGGGFLFQESNANPVSVMHDVAVNHLTGFTKNPDLAMIVIGNAKTNPEMYGFAWDNNIFSASGGIITTGGGATNCAYHQSSAGVLANCFKEWTFSHNVLVGAKGTWPAGNSAATMSQVKFATASTSYSLSQFALQADSPFAGSGSDGKDPGVDVNGLAEALAGVQ